MAPGEESDGIAVPIVWLGPEEVPILMANAFVCQFDAHTLDSLILTVGQLTPPVISAPTVEEREEQARAISYVRLSQSFGLG